MVVWATKHVTGNGTTLQKACTSSYMHALSANVCSLQDDFRRELARASFSSAGSHNMPHRLGSITSVGRSGGGGAGGGERDGGRAQAVLDSISGGDAALLVGGDLTVLVARVTRFLTLLELYSFLGSSQCHPFSMPCLVVVSSMRSQILQWH